MPSRETVLRGSIILIENIPAMPATEQSIIKKCRRLDFFMTERPPILAKLSYFDRVKIRVVWFSQKYSGYARRFEVQ
jgi:hypothetical protein